MNAVCDRKKSLQMDSKSSYIDILLTKVDQKFEAIFDAIDLPDVDLAGAVEAVKKIDPRVDPVLVQTIIQKKLDAIFADPECAVCGNHLRKKYTLQRKIITSIGKMTFGCPYFFCKSCNTYHSPYEDVLRLSQGEYQKDFQKIAARLAANDTFEEAAAILNDFFQTNISADTVHSLTNALAEGIELAEIIPTADEVVKVVEEISRDQHRRPVFVFAADGAMAPIRSKDRGAANVWREIKGVRGYLLDKDHVIHLLSWHQIGTKQDFTEYLLEIREQNIIPLHMVRLCFIGDGAGWIWEAVQEVFPECRQVLDYYHCTKHLYEFAQLHFGNDSDRVSEWVEQTKVRLFHNNIQHVIAGLKRMRCRSEEERQRRDRLVDYLSTHKDRTDYGRLRRGGYPLGSGAIESANKFICHVRLKRSGAWWRVKYANNILKLRCARYNGKLDQLSVKNDPAPRGKRVRHGVKLRLIK